MDNIIIDAKILKEFTKQGFLNMGFSQADAEIGADLLIWCNLRGVDSHGVQRLELFAQLLNDGLLNPKPVFKTLAETPAILFIDADRGLGAISATYAMKQAISKAKNVGIGWALVTNTTTPLAIGYYTNIAVKAGMAGIAATFSSPLMAPYGGKASGLHNGPISIAIPAQKHKPALLDMATSVAAFGKVDVAIDKRISIPENWALDKDGNTTIDPEKAKIALPFGGYKGSGIAFMFECLTGIMAGDPLIAPCLLNKNSESRHSRQNSIMAAINISAFTNLDKFKEGVDDLVDAVKNVQKADGFDEILIPGEPEDRIYDERLKNGIPLPTGTINKLKRFSDTFKVELPEKLK